MACSRRGESPIIDLHTQLVPRMRMRPLIPHFLSFLENVDSPSTVVVEITSNMSFSCLPTAVQGLNTRYESIAQYDKKAARSFHHGLVFSVLGLFRRQPWGGEWTRGFSVPIGGDFITAVGTVERRLEAYNANAKTFLCFFVSLFSCFLFFFAPPPRRRDSGALTKGRGDFKSLEGSFKGGAAREDARIGR